MADNERQLTAKQRAFVDAYLNEANFNGTRAAEIAGYSSPKQQATENLSKPLIRAEIDAYFDKLKNEGLRNKNVRVRALTETVETYDTIIAANAAEAKKAIDAGETIPAAALSGYYERTTKISASGNTVEVWEYNKALATERRATMDQIAKELNDYVTKTELTGKDGGPLHVETSETIYAQLLQDLEA